MRPVNALRAYVPSWPFAVARSVDATKMAAKSAPVILTNFCIPFTDYCNPERRPPPQSLMRKPEKEIEIFTSLELKGSKSSAESRSDERNIYEEMMMKHLVAQLVS